PMVINKDLTKVSPFTANLAHFNALGTAQRWQLTSSNVITQLAGLTVTNGVLQDSVPSQSVTLYVVPATQAFNLQLNGSPSPGSLGVALNGQAGATYTTQWSTDLIHWLAFSTNTLASNSILFTLPTTNFQQIFLRSSLNTP